ncbi:MAG: phenylalanine--tRNA ligase subunit beta [Prevotellaceae bacterium]|jgi:phenylalanyl-tRNA synthetase beta chain|nr:phenylalanine--tRNA ligase subunit beta [Prevotellaceae bacterium]
MKISYNRLKEYIEIEEPPLQLAEVLTSIGLEVESCEVLEQNPQDWVFEIGLTPNRIDAASHLGVARDLAAWSYTRNKRLSVRYPDISTFVTGNGKGVSIEVDEPEGAPRYAGLTLHGIKVGPSPRWLQQFLLAIGLRPINNVVDVANFVLHETGHPLHAFDRAAIEGDIVKVRYAFEGEKLITLDGVERILSAQNLMICDAAKPMCMAGILGGLSSGVSESTTAVFLESALFHPVVVRKSAKRHGLKTDASYRFERGADPDMVPYALIRAAILLQEVAGAQVVNAPIDIYPKPIDPVAVAVNWSSLFALMGVGIDRSIVLAILDGLSCEVEHHGDTDMVVKVPPYRVDVTRECDLAEEILRIWGYNQVEIPARFTAAATPLSKPDPEQHREKMANMWVQNGFNEIMSNSLCPKAWYQGLHTFSQTHLVHLLNPLSSDLNVMRQTLLLGGLETIAHNANRKQNDLKLFEFGNIYKVDPNKIEKGLSAYHEAGRMAIWLTGFATPPQWRHPAFPTHFFYLKGHLEKLFALHGIPLSAWELGQAPEDIFAEGIQYKLNGKVLANMGIISKNLLERFHIKEDVYAAEVDWNELFQAYKNVHILFCELPRFPEVRRDLALILDQEVSYDSLRHIAFKTESVLLKELSLFDVYRGDKVPKGKKQYALSFMLQDFEQTLTDQTVANVMDRLVTAFEKEAGAILR